MQKDNANAKFERQSPAPDKAVSKRKKLVKSKPITLVGRYKDKDMTCPMAQLLYKDYVVGRYRTMEEAQKVIELKRRKLDQLFFSFDGVNFN